MLKFCLATFSFKSVRPTFKLQPALSYLRYHSTDLKHDEDKKLHVERPRWSNQDTEKLLNLVQEHGNKWQSFTKHFPGKHREHIRLHYLTVKHKRQSLSPKDKNMIKELLKDEKDIENIDWKQIQQSLPEEKPISIIKLYYRHSLDPALNKGKWTKKETEQLMDLVKEHGKDWELVSKKLGTRSRYQCSKKYVDILRRQASKKGKFSQEEDLALLNAVNKYGTDSFLKIKEETHMKRTITQLKQRYYNYLDPTVDKSAWSQQEESQFYSLYAELKDVLLVKEKMKSKRSLVDLHNHVKKYRKQFE